MKLKSVDFNKDTCGNFSFLSSGMSKIPLTSINIPYLLAATDRCKAICGEVKSDCLQAVDMERESLLPLRK
jgi:hypothetical protein